MPDELFQNEQMRSYFNSLPPFVQESIRQSGMKFHTPDALRRCAENLLKGDYDGPPN